MIKHCHRKWKESSYNKGQNQQKLNNDEFDMYWNSKWKRGKPLSLCWRNPWGPRWALPNGLTLLSAISASACSSSPPLSSSHILPLVFSCLLIFLESCNWNNPDQGLLVEFCLRVHDAICSRPFYPHCTASFTCRFLKTKEVCFITNGHR